jgi:hypothetical protein
LIFRKKAKNGDKRVVITVLILTKMNIGGNDPWEAGMAGGKKRVSAIGIL